MKPKNYNGEKIPQSYESSINIRHGKRKTYIKLMKWQTDRQTTISQNSSFKTGESWDVFTGPGRSFSISSLLYFCLYRVII